MECMVELDGMDGYRVMYFESDEMDDIIQWAQGELEDLGGGHADIYNEDGEFYGDLEV